MSLFISTGRRASGLPGAAHGAGHGWTCRRCGAWRLWAGSGQALGWQRSHLGAASPARPAAAAAALAPVPARPARLGSASAGGWMTAPASRLIQLSDRHWMCLLLCAPSPLSQALSISCFLNHMGNRHMLHFCF